MENRQQTFSRKDLNRMNLKIKNSFKKILPEYKGLPQAGLFSWMSRVRDHITNGEMVHEIKLEKNLKRIEAKMNERESRHIINLMNDYEMTEKEAQRVVSNHINKRDRELNARFLKQKKDNRDLFDSYKLIENKR